MVFQFFSNIKATYQGKYVQFVRQVNKTDQQSAVRKSVLIHPGSIGIITSVVDGNSELLIALNEDMETYPSLNTVNTTIGKIVIKMNHDELHKIKIEFGADLVSGNQII